jgi:hypothetical protein
MFIQFIDVFCAGFINAVSGALNVSGCYTTTMFLSFKISFNKTERTNFFLYLSCVMLDFNSG